MTMAHGPAEKRQRSNHRFVKILSFSVILAIITVSCYTLIDSFEDTDAIGETSGSCGENITWSIDGSGNLVITGTGVMDDWDFSDVRWGGNDVHTVTISEGVTSIGDYAFMDGYELTSVTIPDSVTSIGSSAFLCCTSLETIAIPGTVTSIGSSAFAGCQSLESIDIPSSLTVCRGCHDT